MGVDDLRLSVESMLNIAVNYMQIVKVNKKRKGKILKYMKMIRYIHKI